MVASGPHRGPGRRDERLDMAEQERRRLEDGKLRIGDRVQRVRRALRRHDREPRRFGER